MSLVGTTTSQTTVLFLLPCVSGPYTLKSNSALDFTNLHTEHVQIILFLEASRHRLTEIIKLIASSKQSNREEEQQTWYSLVLSTSRLRFLAIVSTQVRRSTLKYSRAFPTLSISQVRSSCNMNKMDFSKLLTNIKKRSCKPI